MDSTARAKASQKAYYDRFVKFHPYHPNDLVLLEIPKRQQHKLGPKWQGPYKVLATHTDGLNLQVLDTRKVAAKPISVHFNRVKPFYQNAQQHPQATGCSVLPMFPRQSLGGNPQTILPVPYVSKHSSAGNANYATFDTCSITSSIYVSITTLFPSFHSNTVSFYSSSSCPTY